MTKEAAVAFIFFLTVTVTVFVVLAQLPGSPLPYTTLGTVVYVGMAVFQVWSWHKSLTRKKNRS